MRRSWRRRLLLLAIILTVAYVCLSVVAGVVLAEATLHLPRHPLQDRGFVTDVRDNLGAKVRNVAIDAGDGIELRAWYAVPAQGSGEAVILLHGMGDNRSGAAGYAKLFLSHGYKVLLPDSRAHGESGGAIATYGVVERDDVRRWADWVDSRLHGACVYGFGESMGAGIVLQSLASGTPFCAVIAESPFATFRAIASDRIADHFGSVRSLGRLAGQLPIAFAFAYTRVRYGVDLSIARPIDAVRNSHVPILLIHGSDDSNIRPSHSRSLYNAGASHAQLWIVPGAEHTGAYAANSREFESRVLAWFGSHRAHSAR